MRVGRADDDSVSTDTARQSALLDVTLSGAGLLASAPLWVSLRPPSSSQDGGPVFFGQDRSVKADGSSAR